MKIDNLRFEYDLAQRRFTHFNLSGPIGLGLENDELVSVIEKEFDEIGGLLLPIFDSHQLEPTGSLSQNSINYGFKLMPKNRDDFPFTPASFSYMKHGGLRGECGDITVYLNSQGGSDKLLTAYDAITKTFGLTDVAQVSAQKVDELRRSSQPTVALALRVLH